MSTDSRMAAVPVSDLAAEIATEEDRKAPDPGVALCLSGGGYRAMLFHVGAILRLNELGLLAGGEEKRLCRVSSVSGGSITAGVLALNWHRLAFDSNGRSARLNDLLVQPIRRMADVTIDRGAILGGIFLPGTISERVSAQYREILFGKATLQDLPSDDKGPRFIFNATSVQTGSLVRMSRPFLADYRVGMIRNPKIGLAEVVAASSAFPPVLSPAELDVNPSDFVPDPKCPLQKPPYTDTMVLSDGGVYDNLGLETAWKRYRTILVSDGGGQMAPEEAPAGDWAQHSKRILDLIDNQVRSLRKRQLIASYQAPSEDQNHRTGTYWGIRTNIKDYELSDSLPADSARTQKLAETETRLKRLPPGTQNQLMNWGYAVCDAAVRKHASAFIAAGSPAPNFPFPGGIG